MHASGPTHQGHGHAHHHHHVDPQSGDARVAGAVAINLGLTIAQVVGGLVSGSLALIADALHNLSDAVSLIIAVVARRIARRPADADMTFGFARAEVVAALINYTTLILLGLYLIYEGLLRLIDPQPVGGWIMVAVAGIALAVDLGTAALTYRMSKSSMNIRAAFLHNLADAMGSVAVIASGTVILIYDWRLIDPLVTLMIAGYILWHALAEIGAAIRILMLGSPKEMDGQKVVTALREVDGVHDLHHVHLWQMQEHETALDAHMVIAEGAWRRADAIKLQAKRVLAQRFGIGHATLEIECAHHACPDEQLFGHA